MTLVYGGWCMHEGSYPVSAENGVWECPNAEHERMNALPREES
jgi:hypothetical protein